MSPVNSNIPPRVRELLQARVPIGDAVRLALHERDVEKATGEERAQLDPKSALRRFAERHGLNRPNTSAQLYANSGRPLSRDTAAALAEELGGTSDGWFDLYWACNNAALPMLAAAS